MSDSDDKLMTKELTARYFFLMLLILKQTDHQRLLFMVKVIVERRNHSMYLIARISSLWALRACVITATLLMLLSITLMPGASAGHVQAHSALRSNVNRARVDPNATITNISVSFFTHNDNKDHDTSISVLVQVPVNFYLSQDLGSWNFLVKHFLAEKRETCSSIHESFVRFYFIDSSFDRSLIPRIR